MLFPLIVHFHRVSACQILGKLLIWAMTVILYIFELGLSCCKVEERVRLLCVDELMNDILNIPEALAQQ